MSEYMHLAFDLSFTHTEGRWRAPGSWEGRDFPDLRMFVEIAQMAERGGIDLLFFGDGTGIPDTWEGSRDGAVRWGIQWPRQDMSPYIAALAQVTENIGFGLTYASTFMHPYYTARLLNSLQHLTSGRLAFNVVTSTRLADAANYGFNTLMDHDERYERMEEFIQVCKALWDSVEPDAILRDRTTGEFADPSKVHALDHHGRFFDVRGPLNSVPSPYGHPVLVQAGGSPCGIQASASFADVVFGATRSLKDMVAHRQQLDAALVDRGRSTEDVGILWSTDIIVAETEHEAKDRRERIGEWLPRDAVGVYLSYNSGWDFSTLPDRFALGDLAERIAASNATPAGFVARLLSERGESSEMTRDEFFDHGWRAVTGDAHAIAGTPTQVADRLEEVFEATGRRGGFMLSPGQVVPRSIGEVVDLLVPELRRRGAVRREYAGTTLRENLCS